MYYFADCLAFVSLFTAGFFFGYYCKFAYIYDNLWIQWYAVLSIIVALAMTAIWTLKKYKQKQYRFDHFYVIFYGLICFAISSCFMLNDNLDISFYFGFIGLGVIFVSCYSYISLRSTSSGLRPTRIALGNALYFAGLTTGFSLFNEFEPRECGWFYLGLTVLTLVGTVVNELLQHIGWQNYKRSYDLVFDLMNDEKMVFLERKSIYALFVGRHEFYFVKSRQWLVVGLSSLIALERTCLYSTSFLQLTWSSTVGYMLTQYLYGPFLLYTIGCGLGCILMIRYKPKLIYLMFGMIKITVTGAILGIYVEDLTENCFVFLCFYYISMGIYSSIALHMIAECTPHLYTEVALAIAFSIELFALEMLKFETEVDNSWSILLATGISTIVLSIVCMVLIQIYLPQSSGLIDVRNKLLGTRRHQPVVPQTKIWNSNYFLHHDLQPDDMTCVKLDGNRIFQQYPKVI